MQKCHIYSYLVGNRLCTLPTRCQSRSPTPPPFACCPVSQKALLKKWLPREFWFAKSSFSPQIARARFLSLFLLLTCFFCFFIFSSPSFVTVYKYPLKYFFSLFFFFFKKKKIKKGRAGNLSPKMFKIRMRWGNKSVRKKLWTLVLLLIFWWF